MCRAPGTRGPGLTWLLVHACVPRFRAAALQILLIKGDSEGCYTLEQYQNLKERGGIGGVGEGVGKDHEGHKRQDDKWGGLGTMKTKFISFPAKGRKLSSCWEHGGEARRPGLCWARPPPPLPMSAACGPSSSTHLHTNLGHTNRISAGPSADPMRSRPHARSRPQVAAPRLGMLLLGLW